MIKMKTIISIVMFILLSVSTNAQNKYFQLFTDGTLFKKANDSLIRDIENKLKKINPAFSFNGMTTEVSDTFLNGQYLPKTNIIYQITIQTARPVMGGFLTDLAGSEAGADSLAGLIFYGFFLPHEIGHGLEYNSDNVPNNKFQSEYEANVFATLYWRSVGKEKELQQCYEMAKKIVSKLKDPIPENVDAKQYITEHYDELMQDPYKYGYIQFSQIVSILEDKSLPDFTTYVKKYLQKKN